MAARTVRVYRIESPEGVGVYQHNAQYSYLTACDPRRQPMPSSALLSLECACRGAVQWNGYSHHTLFAFPSLAALRRWFDPVDREAMHERDDVALSVYEVPADAVRDDGVQATFLKCKARLLDRVRVPIKADALVAA